MPVPGWSGETRTSPEAPAGPDLQRAVILSGLTEAQLHEVMAVHRRLALGPSLWATVTPVSERWTMRALLTELSRERDALRQALQNRPPDV